MPKHCHGHGDHSHNFAITSTACMSYEHILADASTSAKAKVSVIHAYSEVSVTQHLSRYLSFQALPPPTLSQLYLRMPIHCHGHGDHSHHFAITSTACMSYEHILADASTSAKAKVSVIHAYSEVSVTQHLSRYLSFQALPPPTLSQLYLRMPIHCHGHGDHNHHFAITSPWRY